MNAARRLAHFLKCHYLTDQQHRLSPAKPLIFWQTLNFSGRSQLPKWSKICVFFCIY